MIDFMLNTLLPIVLKIMLIVMPLMIAVAYLTYAERKVIGYIQLRIEIGRALPQSPPVMTNHQPCTRFN